MAKRKSSRNSGLSPLCRRALSASLPHVLFSLVALAALPGFGATGLDRYQTIVDRRPFGAEPSAESLAAAAALAAPPGESLFKDIRMHAIVQNDQGLKVGLANAKTQKNFWLAIGDVEDGIELLEVEYDNDRAKFHCGTETQWLKLGTAGPAAAEAVMAASVPIVSQSRFQPIVDTNRLSYMSLRARRRAELEAARAKEIQSAKQELTGPALDSYLKDYQMELIRAKGEKGPPLPMPLTPEMDSQLVAEGVLPPQE